MIKVKFIVIVQGQDSCTLKSHKLITSNSDFRHLADIEYPILD